MTSNDMLIAVVVVCIAACLIAKRITRSINISKHGWPPPYLDADGDQVGCDCEADRQRQGDGVENG